MPARSTEHQADTSRLDPLADTRETQAALHHRSPPYRPHRITGKRLEYSSVHTLIPAGGTIRVLASRTSCLAKNSRSAVTSTHTAAYSSSAGFAKLLTRRASIPTDPAS